MYRLDRVFYGQGPARDHPFIPEGRFASLLVRDKELAQSLTDGFQQLWSKAMRDLREIDFHPGH